MEKNKSKKRKFKQKITHKYRLVILNEDTFEERFSVRLSRLNIFVISGFFSIFLVAATTLIIAYTPIKEYIPGYSSVTLKRKATKLVIETDSLKRRLQIMENFTRNLLPVLKGEDSIIHMDVDSTVLNTARELQVDPKKLNASREDSLFREKIESNNRYPLFDKAENKIDIVFFSPLTGNVSQEFNFNEKHFAVDIVAPKGTPVKVVGDGTVIFSEWTAETGYVIIVEHLNGFISVYKHNGNLLKQQGDVVKSGEVISNVGSTGELTTGTHLHFELWYNGRPVNPKNYIDFN